MDGGSERFPVLTFLQLAVARHHDDAAAAAEEALRPCHPPSLGETHPERPRVGLDAGHADVRVTVEPAEPPQAQEALGGDDAERVQRGVQPRHVVPFRGEEDVAIRVVPADLGDVQLAPQEVHHDVERAEARADVPGTGALDRDQRVRAAHVRDQREVIAGAPELLARDQLQLDHRVRRYRVASDELAPEVLAALEARDVVVTLCGDLVQALELPVADGVIARANAAENSALRHSLHHTRQRLGMDRLELVARGARLE